MAPRPQIRPELAKKRQAKITPSKIAPSTLSGDPTAVTLVTNHYILLNVPKKSYQGSSGGSCITKWFPDHKYRLNWPTKRPAKIILKIARFALSGDPTTVTSVTNHSIFIK